MDFSQPSRCAPLPEYPLLALCQVPLIIEVAGDRVARQVQLGTARRWGARVHERKASEIQKLNAARRGIPLGVSTTLFVGGLVVAAQFSPPASAIGGLCEGRPASRSWLDASGQSGPTFIEGTKGD